MQSAKRGAALAIDLSQGERCEDHSPRAWSSSQIEPSRTASSAILFFVLARSYPCSDAFDVCVETLAILAKSAAQSRLAQFARSRLKDVPLSESIDGRGEFGIYSVSDRNGFRRAPRSDGSRPPPGRPDAPANGRRALILTHGSRWLALVQVVPEFDLELLEMFGGVVKALAFCVAAIGLVAP